MKRLIEKPVNFILMALFFGMLLSAPMGMVTVADAHHKPGHSCSGGGQSGCGSGTPPTVSELPIQYMVPVGLAVVLAVGGIVYLARNRNKKSALEA